MRKKILTALSLADIVIFCMNERRKGLSVADRLSFLMEKRVRDRED